MLVPEILMLNNYRTLVAPLQKSITEFGGGAIIYAPSNEFLLILTYWASCIQKLVNVKKLTIIYH